MKVAILITCGKKKQDHACKARDMYTGAHARRAILYAESTGIDWFVIGLAKGLIHPDKVIETYERPPPKKLSDLPENWTWGILKQLQKLGYEQVLFACNKMYYLQAYGAIGTRWAFHDLPIPGMGYQGQWFNQNRGKTPVIEGTLTELFATTEFDSTIGEYATL